MLSPDDGRKAEIERRAAISVAYITMAEIMEDNAETMKRLLPLFMSNESIPSEAKRRLHRVREDLRESLSALEKILGP